MSVASEAVSTPLALTGTGRWTERRSREAGRSRGSSLTKAVGCDRGVWSARGSRFPGLLRRPRLGPREPPYQGVGGDRGRDRGSCADEPKKGSSRGMSHLGYPKLHTALHHTAAHTTHHTKRGSCHEAATETQRVTTATQSVHTRTSCHSPTITGTPAKAAAHQPPISQGSAQLC